MKYCKMIMIIIGSVGGLLLLALLLGLFGLGFGMMGGMMVGMMFGMGIFWMIIIIGLVLLIGYLVSNVNSEKKLGKNGEIDDEEDLAIQYLRRRYAQGDISRDVFLEIKRDLEKEIKHS